MKNGIRKLDDAKVSARQHWSYEGI